VLHLTQKGGGGCQMNSLTQRVLGGCNLTLNSPGIEKSKTVLDTQFKVLLVENETLAIIEDKEDFLINELAIVSCLISCMPYFIDKVDNGR
jgi:hypothetical protein